MALDCRSIGMFSGNLWHDELGMNGTTADCVFKAAQYMVHDVHVECVHNTRKASIGCYLARRHRAFAAICWPQIERCSAFLLDF